MIARSHIDVWVANTPSTPATEGAAIAMLAVIFFLAFSIFGAAMVLRKRARCAPRPEDALLEELNCEERQNERTHRSKQAKPANGRKQHSEKPEWERDADWWKNQDS